MTRQATALPSCRAGTNTAPRTAARAARSSTMLPEDWDTSTAVTVPVSSTIAATRTIPCLPDCRAARG